MDDQDGAWNVGHVDSVLKKLKVLYDGLPPEEQQVLEILLQQSQDGTSEVAGYAAARRVVVPVSRLFRRSLGTGRFP